LEFLKGRFGSLQSCCGHFGEYKSQSQNQQAGMFSAPFVKPPNDDFHIQKCSEFSMKIVGRALDAWGDYWYGYLYAAFWAFAAYCCTTHVIAALVNLQYGLPSTLEACTEIITRLALNLILTVGFGWVTY
jgi:hypothetical protein